MRPRFLSRRLNSFSFRYFVYVMLMVLLLSQPAFGGKLHDFEQDVVEEQEEEKRPRLRYEYEDEEEPGFFEALFGALFRGIFEGLFGGISDEEQEQLYPDESRREFRDRPPNKVLLPFFRFDAGYQNVESDVQTFDSRAELGLGLLGIQGRVTYYDEDDPSDELELIQIHGLLRLPVSHHIGIGLGAGTVILDGNDRNYGFSLTSPLLIYPKDSVGIEFRPSWSWINENPVKDYDLGIVLSRSHVALRLGHRWVRSEYESLDGPYFGFSFRF